jgi:chromosome segregation ATPase
MGSRIRMSLTELQFMKFQPELAQKRREQLVVALNFLDNIKNDINLCNEQLSRTDKAIDQIMHDIEQEDFNAFEGYRVTKALQELRRERRRIKAERTSLDLVYEQAKFNLTQLQTSLRKAITSINDYEHYVGVDTRKVETSIGE